MYMCNKYYCNIPCLMLSKVVNVVWSWEAEKKERLLFVSRLSGYAIVQLVSVP